MLEKSPSFVSNKVLQKHAHAESHSREDCVPYLGACSSRFSSRLSRPYACITRWGEFVEEAGLLTSLPKRNRLVAERLGASWTTAIISYSLSFLYFHYTMKKHEYTDINRWLNLSLTAFFDFPSGVYVSTYALRGGMFRRVLRDTTLKELFRRNSQTLQSPNSN